MVAIRWIAQKIGPLLMSPKALQRERSEQILLNRIVTSMTLDSTLTSFSNLIICLKNRPLLIWSAKVAKLDYLLRSGRLMPMQWSVQGTRDRIKRYLGSVAGKFCWTVLLGKQLVKQIRIWCRLLQFSGMKKRSNGSSGPGHFWPSHWVSTPWLCHTYCLTHTLLHIQLQTHDQVH